jgi:hypothetical protein
MHNVSRRWLFLPLSLVVAGMLSWAAWVMAAEAESAPAPIAAEGSFKPGIAPEGDHTGKDVVQPIEFPHNIHTKDNKINCLYCHTYGRRSKVAGIPPTSKCMGCHSVIATDKPRIQKLTEYWEKRQPIPWKKVHDVPDFVHFTHEKHLKRFIFNNPEASNTLSVDTVAPVCAYCHGDLREMTVAKKVKPLTMGWCVECHKANDGPGDCWKCHK